MKFVKMYDTWFTLDETTPLNHAKVYPITYETYNDIYVDATKLKVVEANSTYDLNWKNTVLHNNNYKTGWLAPNGTFYGCADGLHHFQAEYVLESNESLLEEEGYIKIMEQEEGLTAYFYGDYIEVNPTKAQINYLNKLPYYCNCYDIDFDAVDESGYDEDEGMER